MQALDLQPAQRATTAMSLSVLLRYPAEDFFAHVQVVESQLAGLHPTIAEEIAAFIDSVRQLGPMGVQEHYVETFDQRRRCSMHLSYYAVGDTRQRGVAILAFRQQLAALGLEEISEELPDHLCVLLEALAFTEGTMQKEALEMIASHRDGLEVLRTALENLHSPYAHLIRAVCMMLPELDQATIDRYINLIRQGPPAEMVGIDVTSLPFPTALPDLK